MNYVVKSRNAKQQKQNRRTYERRCYRCGGNDHISKDENCPGREVECYKCYRNGHFAKFCKTKQKHVNFKKRPNKNKVNLVDSDDSDDEDYAFIVNAEKQACSIPVKIGGVPTDMIIDSGATCNLISRLEWERLKKAKVMCDSRKCTKKLFAYGSKKPLDVAGSFTAEISVGKTSVMTEFIVVEGHGQNLLGKETALFLNVLRLGPELVNNVRKSDLLDQFSDVFSGLGKLMNFQ